MGFIYIRILLLIWLDDQYKPLFQLWIKLFLIYLREICMSAIVNVLFYNYILCESNLLWLNTMLEKVWKKHWLSKSCENLNNPR